MVLGNRCDLAYYLIFIRQIIVYRLNNIQLAPVKPYQIAPDTNVSPNCQIYKFQQQKGLAGHNIRWRRRTIATALCKHALQRNRSRDHRPLGTIATAQYRLFRIELYLADFHLFPSFLSLSFHLHIIGHR